MLAGVLLALAGPGGTEERSDRDRPVILDVAAPPRLRVGAVSELRLVYRAPLANVVAVVEAIDDLDGPAVGRSTRERQWSVVARAFGFEAGELTVPLAFATPGWKRVSLRLLTDERESSESAVVEVEVVP